MEGKKLHILMIEDDSIEVMKMNRIVQKFGLEHQIDVAENGEVALEYLENATSLPDIILLDLNMNKINGIEFLRILKSDDAIKFIPTIVLTTSSNPQDLRSCYELGIAGYVLKPLKYDDYVEKVRSTLAYWCLNELYQEYV